MALATRPPGAVDRAERRRRGRDRRVARRAGPGALSEHAATGGHRIESPQSSLRDAAAPVERFLPSHPRIVQPLPVLAQAAAGTGIAGVALSSDDTARWLTGVARSNDALLPGFALGMLRVAVGQPSLMIQGSDAGPEAMRIGERRVPVDVSGRLWIRYARPGQIPVVPAWAVLAGTHGRERLAGRLAIIGTTAIGLADSIPTPIGRPLSAAEIQANAIAAILGGNALSRPASLRAAEIAATLLAGLAVIALARRRASVPLAMAPLLVVPFAAVAWAGFAFAGLLIDTAFAMVATLALTGVALGERMLSDGRALRQRERDLQAALIKAAAADRAKSECLANISHELRTPLPRLRADLKMLRQMLLNLLGNAIKFSPPHSSIDVTVRSVDGGVVISVKDRGPGMGPAGIPRALERFGKLREPSTANPPGVGIGLPLTRAMIELHGGRLEIISRRSEGTETRLCFPPDRSVAPRDDGDQPGKAG